MAVVGVYLTWGRHSFVKWVETTDPVSGQRGRGRDGGSWERAQHKALEDLVRRILSEAPIPWRT
ncbi:MAG: hypothetical protein M3N51_02185 [Actinomycetota bacterium]|nr:hypothetical protein [Actinomycetota bacterium]